MKPGLQQIKQLLILIIFFVADRTFKYYALTQEAVNQGGFFYFTFNINPQAVFGLPLPNWLIIIINSLILFIIVGWAINLRQRQHRLGLFGAEMVLLGGFSNLFDRFYKGGVIDIFSWPDSLYFNLSDIYIIVGLGLIIWSNRQADWFKKFFRVS